MASRDEQADILGGPILQRPESGLFATFAQYHLVFKSVTLLAVGLLVWIACARGLEHLRKHRELRYRKAMRRKHGIPDSDCRPFAVAYAAAKRAHLEREVRDRKKSTNYVSDQNPPAVDQRINAQKDACLLRKRVPETTVQLHDYHVPVKHSAIYDSKNPKVHAFDFADRYHPNPRRRVVLPESLPAEISPLCRASRRQSLINVDDAEESRKRTFEDESDVERETLKKSRIDGDEQGDWYAPYSNSVSRRASLDRQPEGNYVRTDGQERSERVDDLRNEDHESDEAMEGVDEDEVTELEAVARGKKRDRTEAESTFGGDDDDDIRNGRASYHRKRRTISRRIEIPERGQKRNREVESPESEGDGIDSETSERRTRHGSKKRDKKTVSCEVNENSVEDTRVSKDLLCGVHRIGESWEADGVRYKVGDKGERLRLALVKKARNKYHMPRDSQHPDRSAALEIYVETWMTEEQYRQAGIRQELAWQEAPRDSSGSKAPHILDSPMKNGKNLLWDSIRSTSARRPFRQFMPSGASARVNPFEHWSSQPISARRVASSSTIISPILPGVVDSPTRPGFRGFSKWEKQDREAEAMAKIREKIEEQKKAQASPQRSGELSTSVTASELGSKLLSVPTITLTPATATEGRSDDSTSSKSTAAASSAGFSLSSAPIPVATPSTLFPSALAAPSTASSTNSPSPFLFVKPAQVPSSTSTAASSSTLPNIFGKETSTGTPSSTAPASSTLSATNQVQPPSVQKASQPVSFPFTKPDVSSSIVPPPVKPQPLVFNATSSSSSSLATFGFTAAATKAETPAPAVPAFTTPESSKPTTSPFSFSGAFPSTGMLSTSSAPPVPKFSFGPRSTTSTPTPGFNVGTGTTSQAKPTFKFGQTPSGVTDGTSVVLLADEPKKSAMPTSVFGSTAGSNEPVKSSPFGSTSGFGSSSSKSPLTNLFGKPATGDNDSSTSTPPKPAPTSASVTTSDSSIPSTSTGRHNSGGAPVFSFGGANSTLKPNEGSKPTPLFGSATEGSNAAATLGANSTEGKPTFAFGVPVDGPKPLFGGNMENSKAPSFFGGSTEGSKPTFAFGSSAEGPKSTFPFGGPTEDKTSSASSVESAKTASLFTTTSDSSNPSNTTGSSKPVPTPGSTAFGAFSSPPSPFTLGKPDDAVAANTSTSGPQTKPAVSFSFGTPSGANGSTFGQPAAFATSGDPSTTAFGKSTNVVSSSFGFAGAGGPSSANTFTFSKPTSQNQKQEQ